MSTLWIVHSAKIMSETKQKDIKQFAIITAVLVLINILAGIYFFRIDLTEDKRFSLGEPTKALLNTLEDDVEVRVYLSGDFPARFEKIEQSIKDKLQEFRSNSNVNFSFRFIDPLNGDNDSIQKATVKYIQDRGLSPMRIYENEGGKKVEKLIFPGAIIKHKNREVAVNLVQGNVSLNADDRIAQSIAMLEYELANSIKLLAQDRRKQIAFIQGHGEADKQKLHGISRELKQFSDVTFLNLNQINDPDSLRQFFDLVVITQPKTPFTEVDKYKIDQFIMKGGNAAFYLDMIDLRPDTNGLERIIGVPREINLTDQLFSYGVRVNNTMIQDMQGDLYPMDDGKGNYEFRANDFVPIINTYSKHQSVKNSGPILVQNCNTIDTVSSAGIKKTPLVYTSKYTKINSGQIIFNVNDFMSQKGVSYYNKGSQTIAYLLEGKFTSNFSFKPVPKGFDKAKHLKKGIEESSIIVFSDGDVIQNLISPKDGKPLPMGLNQYTKKQYSNREVMSNLFDYQLDATGINSLRIKNIKKRPLDKIKIADDQKFWQILNVGLPLISLLILGLTIYFIRKRKYTKF